MIIQKANLVLQPQEDSSWNNHWTW